MCAVTAALSIARATSIARAVTVTCLLCKQSMLSGAGEHNAQSDLSVEPAARRTSKAWSLACLATTSRH